MYNYYQYTKNYHDKSNQKKIKKGLGCLEFIQLQPKMISEGAYEFDQEERDEHEVGDRTRSEALPRIECS